MAAKFSNSDLEGFLDESLPAERMASIEEALRHSEELQKRLASVNGRRDAGVHSLGEIWRRHRLSCPSREQLGSYLLGVLSRESADYVKFHVENVACRLCAANLADLRAQSSIEMDATTKRRHRYFQSSAGYLRKK